MLRPIRYFADATACAAFVLIMTVARAQPIIQTVFYDMPTALLPAVMPTPTAQLLAVPGYPDDPARLTLICLLYTSPSPRDRG